MKPIRVFCIGVILCLALLKLSCKTSQLAYQTLSTQENDAISLEFASKCEQNIFIAGFSNAAKVNIPLKLKEKYKDSIQDAIQLVRGQEKSISLPRSVDALRVWARTDCSGSTDGFQCSTGYCKACGGGQTCDEIACQKGETFISAEAPTTLAEMTLGSPRGLGRLADAFNISLVDGFSIGVKLEPDYALVLLSETRDFFSSPIAAKAMQGLTPQQSEFIRKIDHYLAEKGLVVENSKLEQIDQYAAAVVKIVKDQGMQELTSGDLERQLALYLRSATKQYIRSVYPNSGTLARCPLELQQHSEKTKSLTGCYTIQSAFDAARHNAKASAAADSGLGVALAVFKKQSAAPTSAETSAPLIQAVDKETSGDIGAYLSCSCSRKADLSCETPGCLSGCSPLRIEPKAGSSLYTSGKQTVQQMDCDWFLPNDAKGLNGADKSEVLKFKALLQRYYRFYEDTPELNQGYSQPYDDDGSLKELQYPEQIKFKRHYRVTFCPDGA